MASAVPVAAPVTVRHYRVWATAFRVEAPDGAILDGLDRVCSQFASESAGGAVELAVTAVEGGGWLIRRPARAGSSGGRGTARCVTSSGAWSASPRGPSSG